MARTSSGGLSVDRLRELARAGAEVTLNRLRAEIVVIERAFPELDAISLRAGAVDGGWLPETTTAMAHLLQQGTPREAEDTAVYPKAEIRDNVVNYVTVVRFQPLTRLLSGALTEDQDRRP